MYAGYSVQADGNSYPVLSILLPTSVGVPNSIQFPMDLRSFQIRPFVEILYFQDFYLFIYLIMKDELLIPSLSNTVHTMTHPG